MGAKGLKDNVDRHAPAYAFGGEKRQKITSVFDRVSEPDDIYVGTNDPLGLGLDSAMGELRDLTRSYNPVIVFLCQT